MLVSWGPLVIAAPLAGSLLANRIAGNGVRVVLVESPDRFGRDLAVQLSGHDYLRSLGVELVPTSAPDFFTTDTPTAVLVRQVLGAISQFEKASLVVQSRSVMESAMLILHSGRPYGTDSSRQRQDDARRPSCYTAIEGFDPRARQPLRS